MRSDFPTAHAPYPCRRGSNDDGPRSGRAEPIDPSDAPRPPDERPVATPRSYRVHGIRIDEGFDYGVSVRPADDGTIDDFPQFVHDALPGMAAEAVDVERVRAETTGDRWPVVGTLFVRPGPGDAVTVRVEWVPTYLSSI